MYQTQQEISTTMNNNNPCLKRLLRLMPQGDGLLKEMLYKLALRL